MAYAFTRVEWNDMVGSLRSMRWGWFLPFFFLIGPILFLATFRWRVLLAAQDVSMGVRAALRLTFIGHFFNTILPGLTGGDVVKAVYVARETPERKSRAVFSMVVDRFAGACGLALVGGVSAFVLAPGEAVRPLARWVGGLCGVCLVFAVFLLSERARLYTGVSWMIQRLPGRIRTVFSEIEGGLVLYRDRPGALLFALVAAVIGQSSCCLIYFGFGRAIGVESLHLADYFVLVTVLSLIKGVSPTPGSAGFAEGVIALVVEPLGLDVTHVVLLSLLMTGAMFVWGWPGAALVAAGRRGGGAR